MGNRNVKWMYECKSKSYILYKIKLWLIHKYKKNHKIKSQNPFIESLDPHPIHFCHIFKVFNPGPAKQFFQKAKQFASELKNLLVFCLPNRQLCWFLSSQHPNLINTLVDVDELSIKSIRLKMVLCFLISITMHNCTAPGQYFDQKIKLLVPDF